MAEWENPPSIFDLKDRVDELEAALLPFVNAAATWQQRNHGWDNDECGELDVEGNPPEWYADIEVCNVDVLRAREAMQPAWKGQGADS